jgi:hypothetical protein
MLRKGAKARTPSPAIEATLSAYLGADDLAAVDHIARLGAHGTSRIAPFRFRSRWRRPALQRPLRLRAMPPGLARGNGSEALPVLFIRSTSSLRISRVVNMGRAERRNQITDKDFELLRHLASIAAARNGVAFAQVGPANLIPPIAYAAPACVRPGSDGPFDCRTRRVLAARLETFRMRAVACPLCCA